MLVLTPKYSSQIDLDLLKKQNKEPLIKHRNDIIDLTHCKNINEAYNEFLDNKDKYIIGYKPKEPSEINFFVYSLGEIDILDVSWIDVSDLETLNETFNHCHYVKHITGLEKWDVSNCIDMWRMFSDCERLESISDISRWDVSNVSEILFMFNGCQNLKTIGDISRWNVNEVKRMAWMFFECADLDGIGDISGWDVSNVKDMLYMFYNCQTLKNVGNLNKWKISQDVRIWHMFGDSSIKPIPSWYTKK